MDNRWSIIEQKKCHKLNISKLARLATIGPERNQHYFVPMVFTFDGNNIFILIYNNPKKLNLHYFKRIEIYTKKYQL